MVNQQLESGHLDDGPVTGDCLATTVAIPLGCICEQVGNTQAEDMLWLQLVLPGKNILNGYTYTVLCADQLLLHRTAGNDNF